MELARKKGLSLPTCFAIAVILLAISDGVFIPLVVYRICYQSTSPFVPSQCVDCPFVAFQGYSFSCIGSTAFPRNITPAQAQCMIQRCQEGIRQTPVYLGRRRRDAAEDDEVEEVADESTSASTRSDERSPTETQSETVMRISSGDKPEVEVVEEIEVYVDSFYDYE